MNFLYCLDGQVWLYNYIPVPSEANETHEDGPILKDQLENLNDFVLV